AAGSSATHPCVIFTIPHEEARDPPALTEEIPMKKGLSVLAVVVAIAAGAHMAAQNPPAGGRGAAAPPQPMGFFVTSVGVGDGANLGGLAGADAHCQKLAAAAGSTRTWHAYLSTQGPNAVNARDR